MIRIAEKVEIDFTDEVDNGERRKRIFMSDEQASWYTCASRGGVQTERAVL